MVKKIQTQQQHKEAVDFGKEIKLLGKVSRLGKDRFIVTIGKKDNKAISEFFGHVIVLTVRRALED